MNEVQKVNKIYLNVMGLGAYTYFSNLVSIIELLLSIVAVSGSIVRKIWLRKKIHVFNGIKWRFQLTE